MTITLRTLDDAELDIVSGGSPNLGGYTACPDGLRVGPCPPTIGDIINDAVQKMKKISAGGRPA